MCAHPHFGFMAGHYDNFYGDFYIIEICIVKTNRKTKKKTKINIMWFNFNSSFYFLSGEWEIKKNIKQNWEWQYILIELFSFNESMNKKK